MSIDDRLIELELEIEDQIESHRRKLLKLEKLGTEALKKVSVPITSVFVGQDTVVLHLNGHYIEIMEDVTMIYSRDWNRKARIGLLRGPSEWYDDRAPQLDWKDVAGWVTANG